MDEIRKLKRSINVIDAKVSYLREGFDGLEKAVKEMNSVKKRIGNIEKHLDL